MDPLLVRPIGFVRSPFSEKVEAPRQGEVARGVGATIELLPEFEHAVLDLEGFERIWILFWFHLNEGWKPKVLPPRSDVKRGVFSTRSPHRPNPIGMSVVTLERVAGVTLHVRDIDLIDGTPVVDIKPYIPYADAFPRSKTGWLETQGHKEDSPVDPIPSYTVSFAPLAEEQCAWIESESGFDVARRLAEALSLGPQPHPYRRIRVTETGSTIAIKEWRARFHTDSRTITVHSLFSGYRSKELAENKDSSLDVHRKFVEKWG